MAITIPKSAKEINDRSLVDVQNAQPKSNPFDNNNFINALISANSNRIFEAYAQLNNVTKELFLHTQSLPFIISTWASYRRLTQNPAVIATGNIVAEGIVGSVIGLENLNFQNGNVYNTTVSKTIVANVLSVASITRIGDVATVTTIGDHNLASGINDTIAGALEVEYNGTFSVTVVSKTVFTYIITGTPVTPATGTITASHNTALIPIESVGFGVSQNLSSGAKLTFTGTVLGVNQSAFVDFDTIGGGTDLETPEEFRARVLEDYRSLRACFNKADIILTAKLVPGVTRVFVFEITPGVGDTTVYFTRDNDPNIIPSGQDVVNVKNQLLTIKGATMNPVDLIVLAPTAKVVNFSFSALTPNTPALQTEITKNLKAFFEDKTEVGVNIISIAYESVIFNTIDPETSQKVTSFTLSIPTGDIVVATGELAILGTVSFA